MEEIKNYFKEFWKRREEQKTLYTEAMKLGQEDRALDILDQTYETYFEFYNTVNNFKRNLQETLDRQADPRSKKFLEEFIDILDMSVPREGLMDFGDYILEIKGSKR